MTEFKMIPVKEIKPDPNQPRKFFDDKALKELTESVKAKGVLQPIMIRPNGKGYILVCGERRLKASIAASLQEVPAVVRTLTDEEALEIQFIENIQRDDVHPMDEATTFKQMLENKVHKYTLDDIAAKINKPASFVAQRLSLNNLIDEFQKDFWKGKFLIGHAVLFSRVGAKDQKTLHAYYKRYDFLPGVSDVKQHIDRNITRLLSSAPFKRDDITLNPAAVACDVCPKRSGTNPSLFGDVKETDRCFDGSCFEIKLNTWLKKKVETVLTEQPEILLMSQGYGDKPDPAIMKMAKDMGVKIYSTYDDNINSYKSSGSTPVKVLWINGHDIGKVETRYKQGSKGTTSKTAAEKIKSGKVTAAVIDDEISRIKDREIRSKQLDEQKIWSNLRQHFNPSANVSVFKSPTFSAIEKEAICTTIMNKLGFDKTDDFRKFFKVPGSRFDKKSMPTIDDSTIAQMIRFFFLAELPPSVLYSGYSDDAKLCIRVAESYFPSVLKDTVDAQKAISDKRQARIDQRIKELQQQKKELKPATKSAKKKTVKKSTK